MSGDLKEELEAALAEGQREIVRRLKSPVARKEIPSHTLVRMVEVLHRQTSGPKPAAEVEERVVDPVEMVRRLGLPDERKVALLANLLSVTADEAASLLASDGSAGT